jgi:hypothetical protein
MRCDAMDARDKNRRASGEGPSIELMYSRMYTYTCTLVHLYTCTLVLYSAPCDYGLPDSRWSFAKRCSTGMYPNILCSYRALKADYHCILAGILIMIITTKSAETQSSSPGSRQFHCSISSPVRQPSTAGFRALALLISARELAQPRTGTQAAPSRLCALRLHAAYMDETSPSKHYGAHRRASP